MSALSLFHLGGSSPESSTTTSEVVAFSSAVTECVQHFGESVPFRRRLKTFEAATALLAVPRRRHRGGT
jgi:hypothetical protein